MQNPSLTEQEKIEAFCRELAQSLREITGRQAAHTEEEPASDASRVTARPVTPVSDPKSAPGNSSQPTSTGGANDADESQGIRATKQTEKRSRSGSARGKRKHNAQ